MEPAKRNWVYLGLTAALLAVGSAYLFVTAPRFHGILWLGLYSIPSHMFISPLPHEPALLYFAKSYSAILCTAASTVACLIAGMWDYWLFVPLMHHPRIRSKYTEVSLYQKSIRFFRKSPFWALVIAGFTPLPFYPVKFLAITDHYPLKRYLLALFVGRTPRYWLIAYLGYVLQLPNWCLAALALLILVYTIAHSHRESKKKKARNAAPANDDSSTSPSPSRACVRSTTSDG